MCIVGAGIVTIYVEIPCKVAIRWYTIGTDLFIPGKSPMSKKSKNNQQVVVVSQPTEPKAKPWLKNPFVIFAGVAIVLAIVLGIAVFFVSKNSPAGSNPVLGAQTQQADVVVKVGALMQLPQNELPTIATVTDISKLQSQPFFANAKNGDQVLLYKQAKEAILYDPQINKIIQVSSLTIPQSTDAAQPPPASGSAAQTHLSPIAVALYNGTTISGLTKRIEAELKVKAANIKVVLRANAAKSTYAKTLVVDLSGSNQLEVNQLANILNGTVGSLPTGESAPPGAAIVVILGEQ